MTTKKEWKKAAKSWEEVAVSYRDSAGVLFNERDDALRSLKAANNKAEWEEQLRHQQEARNANLEDEIKLLRDALKHVHMDVDYAKGNDHVCVSHKDQPPSPIGRYNPMCLAKGCFITTKHPSGLCVAHRDVVVTDT